MSSEVDLLMVTVLLYMDDFSVDCSHPYVSVLAMLGNSPDQMVGVAGLKLCQSRSSSGITVW